MMCGRLDLPFGDLSSKLVVAAVEIRSPGSRALALYPMPPFGMRRNCRFPFELICTILDVHCFFEPVAASPLRAKA